MKLDLMRGDLEAVDEDGGAAGSHSGRAERSDHLSEGVVNIALGSDSRGVDELLGYLAGGVCGRGPGRLPAAGPGVEVAVGGSAHGGRVALLPVGFDMAAFPEPGHPHSPDVAAPPLSHPPG